MPTEDMPLLSPCNLCGEPCGSKNDAALGLVEHTVHGSYHSTPGNGDGALDDTTSYTFSLCEFCLDWLFIQFRIPPKIGYYMGGPNEVEAFRPAEQRVQEDEWRRFKEEFFCEFNRRNEARLRRP